MPADISAWTKAAYEDEFTGTAFGGLSFFRWLSFNLQRDSCWTFMIPIVADHSSHKRHHNMPWEPWRSSFTCFVIARLYCGWDLASHIQVFLLSFKYHATIIVPRGILLRGSAATMINEEGVLSTFFLPHLLCPSQQGINIRFNGKDGQLHH